MLALTQIFEWEWQTRKKW